MIEPDAGLLACGDVGEGKLASPTKIVEKIQECIDYLIERDILCEF